MFILDGRTLSPDAPFSHDGVNYPANWLRLSSLEEKQAIGIQEVSDPPIYDQRFYWGYDQDGNLIPKDHAQLVDQWSQQVRQTANGLLLPSDWMIVREVDNGIQVDPAWRTWREDVRLAAGSKVLEIGQTTTTDQLAAYVTGTTYNVWPLDPTQTQPPS
jgi:hypothetical protein